MNKAFLIKFGSYHSFGIIFGFVEGAFDKMSGAIRNYGRWLDIVTVRLPDIELRVITVK